MERFEVKKVGNDWFVFDNTDNTPITKACPEDVAKEICEDFNAMAQHDFRSIGGPDLRGNKPN